MKKIKKTAFTLVIIVTSLFTLVCCDALTQLSETALEFKETVK